MDTDLLIVGGGPAGTHVLSALTERGAHSAWLASKRVVVLEAGDALGPGLPYGEAADPAHTYGRIARLRRDKGRALQHQFARAVDTLRACGAEVIVRTATPAQSLRRATDAYAVDAGGDTLTARHAVLACGHWHTHRLAHLARAIDWRWDVRRLHADLGDDEDVLVLGTSQSALDLAQCLGARRQQLPPSRVGRITLASRRGMLPSVWGPLRASRVPPGGALSLERLRTRASVRLDDILDAVRRDVARRDGALCEDPAVTGWPSAPTDGLAALRHDLARARESLRTGEEIPWQSALWATVPAVFDLFPRLVAEDRLAIAPRWSQWLRYLEAVHTGAAEGLLDLADAGTLSVCALGEPITLTEDPGGVTARGPLGEARAHRVIDARGHDPSIERSDDVFLRSVLASGCAISARIPFADAAFSADFAGETALVGGRPHWIAGGLWVDPRTFQTRDAEGATGDLYALGPLTLGQYPIYLGLWALRTAAARIAARITAGP